MSYQRALTLANAVMLEGYALYPYRPSALKNQFRWTFGTLAPAAWTARGGCEPSWLEAQILVETTPRTRLSGKLRFLQMRERRVETAGSNGFAPVASLEIDGRLHVPWQEGDLREVDLTALEQPQRALPFACEAAWSSETFREGQARVVQEQWAIRAVVKTSFEPLRVGHPAGRLTVRVENLTPCEAAPDARDEALHAACLSAHLILGVEDGGFISRTDPPEWAREAAAASRSTGCHPTLTGASGSCDLVLFSPFILADHPHIAPESPGDLFDAGEIDEILILRTATLTEEEKREGRATDPRVARLLDRVDQMSDETLAGLHGTTRDRSAGEMVPRYGSALRPGARVLLRPGARRTDAQDLLYAGRIAIIEAVKEDLEGQESFAVTIEGDPAAELHRWYGRFHYYYRDEIEPLSSGS